MRRNVLASSNMMNAEVERNKAYRHKAMFLTFTYRKNVEPAPDHMTRLWTNYRNWCKRIGIDSKYVWVAELHKSGRLHYHAIVWLPLHIKLPYFDLYRLVGAPAYHGIGPRRMVAWWPHGMTNTKRARSPVGYLAKYASKAVRSIGDEEHSFPRGLKVYGVGGLDKDQKQIRRFINLPAWLAERVGPHEPVKRITGGGWVEKLTHVFWPSPWKLGRVAVVGGRSFVELVPALPEGTELCFS